MLEDDRAVALRVARYCARNPVALERLTYDMGAEQVAYRSDKTEGPTAGTETVDPVGFLARVVTHSEALQFRPKGSRRPPAHCQV